MLRLFGRPGKSAGPRRRIAQRLPQVESLEDRLCLSFTPVAPEFPVSTSAIFSQFNDPQVAVAMDADGDFVVAWSADAGSAQFNVFAQRFDRDGVAQGSEILVTKGGPAFSPSSSFGNITIDVAMDADGDFVIVYDTSESMGDEVIASFYSANGNLVNRLIASGHGITPFFVGFNPSVAVDPSGNAVVAYAGGQFEPGDVYIQRFDSAGGFLGNATRVTTDEVGFVNGLSVAREGDGTIITTWGSESTVGTGVFARVFDAGGNATGDPFLVASLSSSPAPSVGASVNGGFVIAWANSVGDGMGTSIQARIFDANGAALTDVFDVATSSAFSVNGPHVAVNEHGDFAVSWGTGLNSTILFRQFNANGTPVDDVQRVNTFTSDFSPNDIAMSDCGEMVIAYSGIVTSASPTRDLIFARLYRDPNCDDTPVDGGDTPTTPDDDIADELIALLNQPNRLEPAGLPSIVPPLANFIFSEPNAMPSFRLRWFDEPFSALIRLSATVEQESLGEISGRVFLDLNGNGVQDQGEPGLRGQTVFLDQNDNGVPDESEPTVETDGRGNYHFPGLRLTRYRVRQDLRNVRLLQTMPERSGPHEVELTVDVNSVPDVDFGTKLLAATAASQGGPAMPEPASPSVPANTTPGAQDDSGGHQANEPGAAPKEKGATKDQAGPPKPALEKE